MPNCESVSSVATRRKEMLTESQVVGIYLPGLLLTCSFQGREIVRVPMLEANRDGMSHMRNQT